MVNGLHGDSASNRLHLVNLLPINLPINLLINLINLLLTNRLPINLHRVIRLVLHLCNLLLINHPITLHLNLQVIPVALAMEAEAQVTTTTTALVITHHLQAQQRVYMVIGKTGPSAHNLAVVVTKLVPEV